MEPEYTRCEVAGRVQGLHPIDIDISYHKIMKPDSIIDSMHSILKSKKKERWYESLIRWLLLERPKKY